MEIDYRKESYTLMNKSRIKKILAISVIIILVGLYLATLILAIFDPTASFTLFKASLIASIGLPIFVWIIMFLMHLI